jgi:hypothetical protein
VRCVRSILIVLCLSTCLLQLLHHLSCRPLLSSKLRTLPLFLDGTWKHYVFLKLRHTVLVAAVGIKAHLAKVMNLCMEFEEDLVETNLNLPVEEPPVLLRHYTGHDTIAFVYHHHASGVTVAPPPRNTHSGANAAAAAAVAASIPSPSSFSSSSTSVGIGAKATEALAQQAEAAKTMQVFNWFYARAKSVRREDMELKQVLPLISTLPRSSLSLSLSLSRLPGSISSSAPQFHPDEGVRERGHPPSQRISLLRGARG